MQNRILICLALFLNLLITKANNSDAIYYVINPYGAKIYDNPRFDAQVIAYANFGDSISKSESIISKDLLLVANNISLPGNWIVIVSKEVKSCIFSAHLSNRKNIIELDLEGSKNYNLKGKLLGSSTNIISQLNASGGKLKTTTKEENYENALVIEKFTDCLFKTLNYKEGQLNELYFEILHNYIPVSGDGQLRLPANNSQRYNEIFFESIGLIEDLKITISSEEGSVISF